MPWICVLAVPLASPALAGSSFSKGPNGTLALYLFHKELGYDVFRAMDVAELDGATSLALVHGVVSRRQLIDLYEWVKKGRTAIVVQSSSGHRARDECKDISFGNYLTIRRSRPHEADSETKNRQICKMHPDLSFRSTTCLIHLDAGRPLIRSEVGALAVEYRIGSGLLLVLADDQLVTNAGLNEDDTAVFLRRWVSGILDAGGRVGFVESTGGKLWRTIKDAKLLPLLCQMLVILLLVYWHMLPRFGEPVESRGPVAAGFFSPESKGLGRRAFIQHTDSLGHLYQRARGSAFALEQIYERVKLRVGKLRKTEAFEMSSDNSDFQHDFVQRISTRSGESRENVERLVATVEATLLDTTTDSRKEQLRFRLARRLVSLYRRSGRN